MAKLKYWLPSFIWMGLIFFLSSRPSITTSAVDWQDFVIKKTAHFIEYFILSALLFYSLRHSTGWSTAKIALVSFFASVFYAATDEFHQSFIPGRTPRVRDILIDALGVSLAQFFHLRFANI